MLKVLFLNDGTGDEEEGNYKYKVMINEKLLKSGYLKGHERDTGWEGLLRYFVDKVC